MNRQAPAPEPLSRRRLSPCALLAAALLVSSCGGLRTRTSLGSQDPSLRAADSIQDGVREAQRRGLTGLSASRPGIGPDPDPMAVSLIANPLNATTIDVALVLGQQARTRLNARGVAANPWPLAGGGFVTLELFRLVHDSSTNELTLSSVRHGGSRRVNFTGATWEFDAADKGTVNVALGPLIYEGGVPKRLVYVLTNNGRTVLELTDP